MKMMNKMLIEILTGIKYNYDQSNKDCTLCENPIVETYELEDEIKDAIVRADYDVAIEMTKVLKVATKVGVGYVAKVNGFYNAVSTIEEALILAEQCGLNEISIALYHRNKY